MPDLSEPPHSLPIAHSFLRHHLLYRKRMPKVMAKKKLRREEEEGTFGNKEEGEAVLKMKKKKSNSPIHSSKKHLEAIIKVPTNPEEEEAAAKSYKEGRKNKKKNKVNEDESTLVKDRKEEDVDYLPGQKHDKPGERDPLRIFYETLYHKLPDNELAETWMMEWGLLPPDKAKVVYETKLGKGEYQVEDASLKKASKVLIKKAHKRSSSNTMLKTKKRKVSENSSRDDSRLSKRKVKKQGTSS